MNLKYDDYIDQYHFLKDLADTADREQKPHFAFMLWEAADWSIYMAMLAERQAACLR